MIIWLASYPRSGSTLVRIALHSLFELPSGTVYPIADDVETVQPIVSELPPRMTLEDTAVAPGPCFLKTQDMPGHDSWPALYLVRDGRDALVSNAHYVLHTEHGVAPGGNRTLFLEVLEELITSRAHFGGRCTHVLAWMPRIPSASIICFEDLIVNPGEVLEDALAAVGLGGRLATRRNALPSFDELHKAAPWFFVKERSAAGERKCRSVGNNYSGSITAAPWKPLATSHLAASGP